MTFRPRAAVWAASLVLTVGCRLEDHTPAGTRHDEDAIQHVVNEYARHLSERDWSGVRSLFWDGGRYAGFIAPGVPRGLAAVPIDSALDGLSRALLGSEPSDYDVRIVRTDLRQEGDLAAVWASTRRRIPGAGGPTERDWVEHLVLRRAGDDWRILSVAATPWPRRH